MGTRSSPKGPWFDAVYLDTIAINLINKMPSIELNGVH